MKNTKRCPKCSSQNIVRVPDNQNRHASGNNIYTSTFTLMKIKPSKHLLGKILIS